MNDPAVLTSISNGFHLVHIIVVDDVVKCSVEFVEEVHHLMGGAGAWQLSEAHNITKDEQMRTDEQVSPLAKFIIYILLWIKHLKMQQNNWN